jgi:hypothetical protein
MPLSNETKALLDGPNFAHLATLMPDGSPQSVTCRWKKPVELAGFRSTEYVSSGVDDIQFDKSKDAGYAVGKIANGDKYFIRYEGTAVLKKGVPFQLAGGWKFTGGTGKLRGLTGQGTYTAQPTSAGEMVFTIKGKYRILPQRP